MPYILAAKRSPIGGFMGSLSQTPIAAIAADVLNATCTESGIPKTSIDETILGNVLPAAQGMNLARQTAMQAGLPHDKTALTINQVCASGLRSVGIAAQTIESGMMNMIAAGGLESMSQAPHALSMRTGTKLGNAKLIDTMQNDGLHCALADIGMGVTAENLAEHYQISRKSQDEFAYQSQKKAEAAIAAGAFTQEIHPITLKSRKGDTLFAQDEHPRLTELDKLATLPTVFKKDGTVTAANASGINDGAALLLIGNEAMAKQYQPMARILGWATSGVDPKMMGIGPVPAIEALLHKTGIALADIDLFELNEAFAAQALAVLQLAGIPPEKTNICGGAIALGHPLGASGGRILVTLTHALARNNLRYGIASLCAGGGMGIAMLIENLSEKN